MKILILILLWGFTADAQLVSIVVRGDTLFSFNPSTTTEVQLTKLIPAMENGKVLSNNGTTYNWVDKLSANGNGSALTGLTASQVGLGNVTNESKATMFANSALTGSTTAASLSASGAITSTGGGLGYATGAGGTVTQSTNKTTGVTLNKLSGQITMNNAALAAAAEVSFTLTNSFIAATDVVIVNIQSVGTAGSYFVTVGAVGNGSCSITVGNVSTGSLSQAVVLNFCIIKSVNN